jgi:flagella basal body P-ring formation protein FlgA
MVRGLIILTLLVWATQTLLSQWGWAADIENEALPAFSEEKFVPSGTMLPATAVELKSEATIAGSEIRLKQIARWSDADAPAMQQNADLVVARLERGQSTRDVDIEGLKETLEAAGVNLAAINFQGALACKVKRSESRLNAELEQVIVAAAELRPTTRPVAMGMAQYTPPTAQSDASPNGLRSLRDMLMADLVERLSVPAESLQVRFSAEDEKLVALTGPHFQFDVEPQKLRKLGDLTWNVTISAAGAKQKASISANARMWLNQLATARPLAYRQIIRDEDVTSRRVLVDRLTDEVSLAKEQVVGQQAGRDLGPGAVLTGRMVEAVQMARLGQLITVTVGLGRVQVTWVGEAREAGCLGQTIRVRKPGTREEFSVVLIGPQQAKLIGSPEQPAAGKLAAR